MGFGGKERLKNFLQVVGRQANTTVGNRNTDALAPGQPGAKDEFVVAGRAAGHGVAGVHHEIKQDLLKLHAVGVGRRQSGREFGLHGHTLIHRRTGCAAAW